MPLPKKLIVETDGDCHPKDIYLVDEDGMRVCEFTCHCARRMSEVKMRHLASAVAAAYNQVHGGPGIVENKQKGACQDDSCDLSHCSVCGSHMIGSYLGHEAICDSCKESAGK